MRLPKAKLFYLNASAYILLAVFCLGSVAPAQTVIPVSAARQRDARFLPLAEVRAGMKGVSQTVFSGTEPEQFGVEILGVVPGEEAGQNMIIARLSGKNVERTGVFKGMSGSPVYVGGRLVGAIAFSFDFSKEPLAGITPIEQMVDNVKHNDTGQRRIPRDNGAVSFAELASAETPGAQLARPDLAPSFIISAGPGSPLAAVAGKPVQQIGTPLMYSGLRPEVVSLFTGTLAAHNLFPVAGLGGGGPVTPLAQFDSRTLTPGRSVSVELVRGDYSFAAAGTVTFRDGDRIYAFGHNFLRIGATEMPMNENSVVTVVPGYDHAFKIVAPGRMVGVITQDRSSGIYGQLGRAPRMIPVRINLNNSRGRLETFNMEVVNDPILAPPLLQIVLLNSVISSERTFGAGTLQMDGEIRLAGQPPVQLKRRVANNSPAISLANVVMNTMNALMSTGFDNVRVQGIEFNLTSWEDRFIANLERITLEREEVERGATVELKAYARTMSGAQFVQRIPLRLPADLPLGELKLTLGDGVVTQRSSAAQFFVPRNLTDLVNTLNNIRQSDRLYLRLFVPSAGAVIADKELPNLPPSMRETLNAKRNAGGVTMTENSPVYETEIPPADFIITGKQELTLKVVR